MKIRIGRDGEFSELSKYDTISIIDDTGNEYLIEANDPWYQGKGIKIYDINGDLLIKPSTSNVIHIFSTSKIKI